MPLSSDPWILDSLAILLMAVGGSGLIAVFISQSFGPAMKRSVAVICAAMAICGGLLMVRAATLRDADRDLDPVQQANLAKAVSQFPNARFEVLTADPDNEARALTSKVVDAVKAGSGAMPMVGETPPSSQKGVVMVLRDKESDLGRAVSATIGRAFMAARVAAITDDEPTLDDRTVRIVVGQKP